MQDDVGVNYQVVTLLQVILGVLCEADPGQNGFVTRERPALSTILKSTWNVIPHISLSKDYQDHQHLLVSQEGLRASVDLPFRTLPRAVFLKNLLWAKGKSSLDRLRMVIGGRTLEEPAEGIDAVKAAILPTKRLLGC